MALLGLRFDELADLLEGEGIRRAHALPLFQALHRDFDEDDRQALAPPLRRWIEGRVLTPRVEIRRETASSDGWTRKFLLGLEDGAELEAVLMGFPGRFTACLSTQVGCAMGCVFCATGQMGFRRHLQAAEIVTQARHLEAVVRRRHGDRIRNLVLMGMGEPLHNFEASMAALRILTDTRGLNIGPSRVTVSTVGHVPGIRRLARTSVRYSLAVSLHGATDEERGRLVPVNRAWPLAEVMEACRDYSARTGRRVFMAWTLIADRNDQPEQAARLAELLQGMDVHVNLIPLNPTPDFDGKPPAAATVRAFQQVLHGAGLPSTVRQRRGIDVAAGCGQLAVRERSPEP